MAAHDRRQPVAFLLLSLAACGAHPPEPKTSAEKEVLPFLADDYPRALAEAKRTNKALFVDAWAPWCHSCLSMRAFVLGDRSLEPLAKDFVWLTVDTEKAENAGFVARFPNKAWPTLWVIDPKSEEPTLEWAGTATAPELVSLLEATRSGGGEATAEFVRGNRSFATGDLDGARRSFEKALLAKDDGKRARIVEGLVSVLLRKKDHAACAEVAAREAPALASGTSRADVLAMGLSCASEAKKKEEEAKLEELALRVAETDDGETLADDRSALFESVVERREASGDPEGKKTIATKWAAFLEREASRAPSREARAVFDAHRVLAYIALGVPERAIPMLEESERDFPADYNPPARLARVYLEAKKLDLARAAIARASSKVYGPRTLRVLALAADIAKERGDRAEERAALEKALVRTASATLGEAQKKLRDSLEARLARLR